MATCDRSCERHNYNTMTHQRFSMVFTNPLITIHIIMIITPGPKTAPEGKLTRLAPPCSSSACLGWTYLPRHALQRQAVGPILTAACSKRALARPREARLGSIPLRGGWRRGLGACCVWEHTPLLPYHVLCWATTPRRPIPFHIKTAAHFWVEIFDFQNSVMLCVCPVYQIKRLFTRHSGTYLFQHILRNVANNWITFGLLTMTTVFCGMWRRKDWHVSTNVLRASAYQSSG